MLTMIADDGPLPPMIFGGTSASPETVAAGVVSLRATVVIEGVLGEVEVMAVRFPGGVELARVRGNPFDRLVWRSRETDWKTVLVPGTTTATPQTFAVDGPFEVFVRREAPLRIASRVVARTVLLPP